MEYKKALGLAEQIIYDYTSSSNWREVKYMNWTTVEVQDIIAKALVKKLSIPDVVGQSEQLLALAQYMCEHQNNLDGKTAKDYLQDFLSQ